jgi:hypothetical protein
LASTLAENEREHPGPWPAREAIGRVGRWFFFAVVLATIPVLISFLWLPKNSSVTTLLSHGDLAVIAAALVGISMGELIGPDEPPQKWIRDVLMCACILFLLGAVVLLSLIASRGGRLSSGQEVEYSFVLFVAAVLVGMPSMALTVRRD